MSPPRRFSDQVDEIADRLDDVADTFRARRDELLEQLAKVKEAYDEAVLVVEDWAVEKKLITSCEWTDEDGEPFLPVARVEVFTEPVPDLATMFRERVARLRGEV